MIEILRLGNEKAIYIDGNELTQDDAHEIIIRLTETWGTDFEKEELCDMALGVHADMKSSHNAPHFKAFGNPTRKHSFEKTG